MTKVYATDVLQPQQHRPTTKHGETAIIVTIPAIDGLQNQQNRLNTRQCERGWSR